MQGHAWEREGVLLSPLAFLVTWFPFDHVLVSVSGPDFAARMANRQMSDFYMRRILHQQPETGFPDNYVEQGSTMKAAVRVRVFSRSVS